MRLPPITSRRASEWAGLGSLPRKTLMEVFPLSPSDVKRGALSGCTLRRALRKWLGWEARAPHPVLRGSLIDRAVQVHLQNAAAGIDASAEVSAAEVWTHYATIRDGYHEFPSEADQLGFLAETEGHAINVLRALRLEERTILGVQARCLLWIGNGDSPEVPDDIAKLECPEDWVIGFADWIEVIPGSKRVRVVDLKVTSSPVRSSGTVGPHRLQLLTYAGAELQKGLDVAEVALAQYIPKEGRFQDPWPSEAPGALDLEHVVRIYRSVRDHYLSVIEGKADFLVPMRGDSGCTDYGCWYYRRCPYGLGEGKMDV